MSVVTEQQIDLKLHQDLNCEPERNPAEETNPPSSQVGIFVSPCSVTNAHLGCEEEKEKEEKGKADASVQRSNRPEKHR